MPSTEFCKASTRTRLPASAALRTYCVLAVKAGGTDLARQPAGAWHDYASMKRRTWWDQVEALERADLLTRERFANRVHFRLINRAPDKRAWVRVPEVLLHGAPHLMRYQIGLLALRDFKTNTVKAGARSIAHCVCCKLAQTANALNRVAELEPWTRTGYRWTLTLPADNPFGRISHAVLRDHFLFKLAEGVRETGLKSAEDRTPQCGKADSRMRETGLAVRETGLQSAGDRTILESGVDDPTPEGSDTPDPAAQRPRSAGATRGARAAQTKEARKMMKRLNGGAGMATPISPAPRPRVRPRASNPRSACRALVRCGEKDRRGTVRELVFGKRAMVRAIKDDVVHLERTVWPQYALRVKNGLNRTLQGTPHKVPLVRDALKGWVHPWHGVMGFPRCQ